MNKNTTDLREQILFWLDKGAEVHAKQPDPEMHKVTNGMVADQILSLISNREKLARIDEVNRIATDKELDLKWYLRFDGAECNPQESGEENVANAVMDYVEKRQKELTTLRKELDREEPTNE